MFYIVIVCLVEEPLFLLLLSSFVKTKVAAFDSRSEPNGLRFCLLYSSAEEGILSINFIRIAESSLFSSLYSSWFVIEMQSS